MQQFAIGFVIALLAVVAVAVLYLRRKLSAVRQNRSERPTQFEELARLTGEIAHEIKNPLSTIKINLKLTSEELERLNSDASGTRPVSPGVLRKIAVIQKETDRLEHILTGFLRYLDRSELQPARGDINELISDMIDFYSPQAYSHSITIRQGLYGKPLVCKVDANMLKQAILNLFINSQQAMSHGGELMIRTAKDEASAVITVSDTGSGIAPEKLPNIFDAYYSSRPGGSGLGLPTAKRIVEANNGSISVNSELGKGTLFTIKLPLVTVDNQSDEG